MTTTGRSGGREKESFVGEQLTGPFHRHDDYGADGRPRCWCGSIAERDHASGTLVCALAGEPRRDRQRRGGAVGRITEAVDDVALAVESAWRRFSEPGELGCPSTPAAARPSRPCTGCGLCSMACSA